MAAGIQVYLPLCIILTICIFPSNVSATAAVPAAVLPANLPNYVQFDLDSRSKSNDDKLLNIAKYGLPNRPINKDIHVVIVGAGIAGMSAGYTLQNAGYKVTWLEASHRAGGRIRTHYGDGWYAELGPMRIPTHHNFTRVFVDKFNLITREFYEENNNTWYYVNGQKVRKEQGDSNPELLHYDITKDSEKGKNAEQLFEQGLQKVREDCALDIACLKNYDKWTVEGYLYEEGGLSEHAVDMVGTILDEDNLFFTSLSESLVLQYILGPDETFYEVKGGNEQIAQSISANLDISYNSMVTEIQQSKDNVTVLYNNNQNEKSSVVADYVIVTTTLRAANFIKFTPMLKPKLRIAIKNMHYLDLVRIILVFSEAFWLDDNIRGGRTVTDLPIRYIYYPSHHNKTGPYPIIASYTASDDAVKFTGLTDDECIKVALDDMSAIHGDQIRNLYIEGVVKKWDLDRYALGGVICSTPYQIREYYNTLKIPDGRIYFGGEATDIPRGWMDTSIKSAMRIICKISGECPQVDTNARLLFCEL